MLVRRQWIGLALVVVLLAATVTFVQLVPQRPLADLSATDTLAAMPSRSYRDTIYRNRPRYPKHTPIPLRMHRFNPNFADSIELLEQGLKPWQASNLIHYRRAGGRFRKRSDMRRLYGLSEEQYRKMVPYIDLPDSIERDTLRRDTLPRYVSQKRDTVLELNTADTAELQLLRGIGRWTAVQMVRYREQLGGYYSTRQLYEIEHIDHAMLDTVVERFTVDTTLIRRINVNRCAVSTLSHHPYLRFEQAKAIYELRRNKVRLLSVDDLRSLPQLSPELIDRLSPYLVFE